MSNLVTIAIPAESASRSKMQKKGWKCWAKWLSSVASPANDGYAYEGEFTTPGSTVEAQLGDVLLHVDQSSDAGIAVLMLNRKGEPYLKWMASAPSDGRKWCGPLASPARSLLAMTRDERIRHAAAKMLADNPEWQDDPAKWSLAIAYYSQLAGLETAEAPPQAVAATDAKAQAVARVKALMAELGVTVEDLA